MSTRICFPEFGFRKSVPKNPYRNILKVYNFVIFSRLIKCLIELKWFEEASDFFSTFCEKFPNQANSQSVKTLEKRMDEVKIEMKENEAKRKRNLNSESNNESSDDENDDSDSEENSSKNNLKVNPLEQIVEELKSIATDFTLRFCGHCNTTTDIKEANFFGR